MHAHPPSVRFWPHTGDPNIASTRIRCLQVVQALQAAGCDAALFVPGEDRPDILVLAKRYDRASLERAETLRERAGTRLVLDLCDNHFFHKHATAQWVQRAQRLRDAATCVDHVVAASPTLAAVVRQEVDGATPVSVIGDSLDVFPPTVATPAQHWHALRLKLFLTVHPVAIGRRLQWFGNHGSSYADGGMQDLPRIAHALADHHREQALTLVVVSNSVQAYRRHVAHWPLPTLYLPWSNRVFGAALATHSIALIPAQLNPFTTAKTNNRLATAFSNGLAVAADRLPSYEEFADQAILGDWYAGLGTLMADAGQRRARIASARQGLQARYGQEAIGSQWRELADRLMAEVRPRRLPAPTTRKTTLECT